MTNKSVNFSGPRDRTRKPGPLESSTWTGKANEPVAVTYAG